MENNGYTRRGKEFVMGNNTNNAHGCWDDSTDNDPILKPKRDQDREIVDLLRSIMYGSSETSNSLMSDIRDLGAMLGDRDGVVYDEKHNRLTQAFIYLQGSYDTWDVIEHLNDLPAKQKVDLEQEFKNLMDNVLEDIEAKKYSGEYSIYDATDLSEKIKSILDHGDTSRYGNVCPEGHDNDLNCGWSPSMGYHC